MFRQLLLNMMRLTCERTDKLLWWNLMTSKCKLAIIYVVPSLYTVFIRLTNLGAHLRLGTCLFCNKTINSNNKMRRRNKARFLYSPKKLRLQESLSLELYQFWGRGGGGGRGAGCLFEAGRLLHVPFSVFRIGTQVGPNLRLAYSNKYSI